MLLYEVSLRVERGSADALLAWLPGHMQRILALPGFEAADAFEVVEQPPDAGHLLLCMHYRLHDGAALDTYLRDHAARMRAESAELSATASARRAGSCGR